MTASSVRDNMTPTRHSDCLYDAEQPENTATTPSPVMILAHNEQERIGACLDSILGNAAEFPVEIFVMANGCTDDTGRIVLEYAARWPNVHLVSIEMGDKCNAWNVFIHETVPKCCPNRKVYFFVDGDAQVVPGSLKVMADALRRNPDADASSAPPHSGRSREEDSRQLVEGRHLVANLYALRGSFVNRLQAEGVRLPLKLEGDDGLLGALIKWDLRPELDEFNDRKIEPCPSAGFTFDSVDWRDWSELRGYWRRLVRYGRRRYEFELLGRQLRRMGIRGLPRDIRELYVQADGLKPRIQGIYTLTNYVALLEMRREGRRRKMRS